jgi:Holliday junction resolvase
MGKMQRNKGHQFERDIVNALKNMGYDAARNLNQTRDSGGDINLARWLIECKRYATIGRVYGWLDQAIEAASGIQKPIVIAKADREEEIVIMRLSDFWELMNVYESQAKNTKVYKGLEKAPPSI